MALRSRGSHTETQTIPPPSPPPTAKRPPLSRKRRALGYVAAVLLVLLTLYIAAGVIIRVSPWTQQFVTFMHHLRTPFLANYSNPAEFGLYNTRQFDLSHPHDGCTVPAWHVLPRAYLQRDSATPDDRHEALLADGAPIVLYLHGNTGTRATPHRVELYRHLAEVRGYHVVTFDYRGFAESSCYPSEQGMMEDGRLVWRWIKERAPDSRLYIWGHSLGSAAATHLVDDLQASGMAPDGLILDAPFTSIIDAACSHPLARPYWPVMPLFRYLVLDTFTERFESLERVRRLRCRLLILHGHRDVIIPFDQGRRMYEAAVAGRRADSESSPQGVEFVDCGETTHKNNYAAPLTQAALDRFI